MAVMLHGSFGVSGSSCFAVLCVHAQRTASCSAKGGVCASPFVTCFFLSQMLNVGVLGSLLLCLEGTKLSRWTHVLEDECVHRGCVVWASHRRGCSQASDTTSC